MHACKDDEMHTGIPKPSLDQILIILKVMSLEMLRFNRRAPTGKREMH